MENMGLPVMGIVVMLAFMAISIFVDFFGHKDKHVMGLKEASLWSIGWIALAIAYGFFLKVYYGAEASSLYFSGYALEKALSVDNLVVFTAIFASFGIKCQATQHRILLWGIAGALIFRGIFVALGTELFNLHWGVQVLFAVIVAWSAKAVLFEDDGEDKDYSKHPVIKLVRKFYPVAVSDNSGNFFTVINKVKYVTPAFLCMVVIELSDVMFSFDSVPAVIGVTQEPFLVYACMIFAILGLRALYFVLNALLDKLHYLNYAIAGLLLFVAGKLALGAFGIHVDPTLSLYIVLGTLASGVIASIAMPEKKES